MRTSTRLCRPLPATPWSTRPERTATAEGKIKGNGTLGAREACLHKVWRGTPRSDDGAAISPRAAPLLASQGAVYAGVR
jgi:hypothetical protein